MIGSHNGPWSFTSTPLTDITTSTSAHKLTHRLQYGEESGLTSHLTIRASGNGAMEAVDFNRLLGIQLIAVQAKTRQI